MENIQKKLKPALYIVATPIGHPKDITLRALDVLERVDHIVCEEIRLGSTFLKKIGLQRDELFTLNEHNEREIAPEMVNRLLMGQSLALISDGGTPVFSDPGSFLIRLASEAGVAVIPLPGASSLMAALSILDFKLENFYFAGFLSPKNEIRKNEFARLKTHNTPIILMDTPYRLVRTLEEVQQTFGGNQKITLACDLTLKTEAVYRGSVSEVLKNLGKKKAEFIMILHASKRKY